MVKLGDSIINPNPQYGTGDATTKGITSRDLNISVTPQMGLDTGRLTDVPGELSNGGDSSNPLDYAASLPFRGIGMAGQALGSGIKLSADIIGASPIGWVASQKLGDGSVGDVVGNIGKVFLDILAKPGEVVQDFGARLRIATANGTLPPDIQAMVDSHVPEEEIIAYMRQTGRSLANDRGVNLGLSLLLDPLNLTPFALGKANLLRGLGKIGTTGAGIAAGAIAGPVGAAAGGLAGYALGGRVGTKMAELGLKVGAKAISTESGLDLAAKARAIQTFEKEGKALTPDLNKGRYLLYNEIDKAIFRPMRNVAAGVKEGLKLKTGQILLRGYGSSVVDDFTKGLEEAFGPEVAKLGLRRFALAKTNSIIQGVSRTRFSDVEASVDNVVENIDADIKVALQDYKDARYKNAPDEVFDQLAREKTIGDMAGMVGSSDYVMARLRKNAGEIGLEGKYNMNEQEITAFLQDAAPGYGPRVDPGTSLRIVDGTTTVQAAKNRLRNRLLQARTEAEMVNYDPVKDAVRMAGSNMDAIDSGILDEINVEVKREAEYIGISASSQGSESLAASKRAYGYAKRIADDAANSVADDLGRTSGRIQATEAQVAAIARNLFGDAEVSGQQLINGKYFDGNGVMRVPANLARELSQRSAFARATAYGYNINRIGNVRRVLHLASLFSRATLREKELYAKDISKTLGKPLTVRELEQIAPRIAELTKGNVTDWARPTFVKSTSLIDTKVEQWIAVFENLGDPAGLIASQYPEVPQSLIAKLNGISRKGPTSAREAKELWATSAAAAFEDVAAQIPGYKLGSGAVSAQQVKDFLTAAKNASATTSRATPKELNAMRQAWVALGGNLDEIDGIIQAAKNDGYEIGIAPADNVIREPRLIATVEKEGLAVPEVATVDRPFIDITSDFVDGLPDLTRPGSYRVGGIKGAIQSMINGVPQSLISSSAAQRLQLVLRDRFTVDEIDEFYRRVNEKSVQSRIGQRGLSSNQLEDIMGGILQEKNGGGSVKAAWEERVQALERAGIRPPDLQMDVIKAFKAELGQSGYSQWITSELKTAPGIGKHLAWVAENVYPTLKYKINPMFFAQELIESPFYAELRGMNKKDMQAKLAASGYTSREIRQMFGERTAAQAINMHEQAFFSFTARSRGAAESALKDGLTAKDILGNQKILEKGWDLTADFKEQYRDLMAASDMASKFQSFVQKNMPSEYVALHTRYGPDAFDQLLGWMNEYKRMQAVKFGGSGVNTMKAPGFGFAVNPSATGLAQIISELNNVLPMHTADKFAAIIQGGARPRLVTSTFRAKFINAAQDAGYDVSSARTALDQLDNLAQRYALELNRVGPNLQFLKTEYNKALDKFGVEVRGLTAQLQLADVHKAIVQELMDAYMPGFSKTAEANKIIEAIANSRKYGAKFATMGNLIEQIRIDAGDMTTLSAGARDTIRQTVQRYSKFGGERGIAVRSTQDILTDTTSNLLKDHSGEEAMFEAAKWSYAKSVEEMNKVNYFQSNRTWFERSINHPFLGLYPFSYMYGKVLPELARFMFYRPFGAIAPGAGYAAYRKISQYLSYNGLPPGWETTKEKPDWQFLLVQLVPGIPEDMTVVTPHWFRSGVSTISRQGYDQYKATDLLGETTDWVTRTGVGGFGQLLAKSK
ncbi:MAG: hypothetical protein EBR82_12935 [Caulobacteraceae bacterium]|nr:hypothetical protein [Caulobacteraceae bacterium]